MNTNRDKMVDKLIETTLDKYQEEVIRKSHALVTGVRNELNRVLWGDGTDFVPTVELPSRSKWRWLKFWNWRLRLKDEENMANDS